MDVCTNTEYLIGHCVVRYWILRYIRESLYLIVYCVYQQESDAATPQLARPATRARREATGVRGEPCPVLELYAHGDLLEPMYFALSPPPRPCDCYSSNRVAFPVAAKDIDAP